MNKYPNDLSRAVEFAVSTAVDLLVYERMAFVQTPVDALSLKVRDVIGGALVVVEFAVSDQLG